MFHLQTIRFITVRKC